MGTLTVYLSGNASTGSGELTHYNGPAEWGQTHYPSSRLESRDTVGNIQDTIDNPFGPS